jgi:hemerythrin-like metal-binding protein
MSKSQDSELYVIDRGPLLPDSIVQELGLAGIDDNHHEFVDIFNALRSAELTAEFQDIYHELHMHSEKHFWREFDYMQACEYPALVEHHAEHLRIINEMVHYRMRLQQGRLKTVQEFIDGRLRIWFQRHMNGPDMAMALYPLKQLMQKGQYR